MKTLDTVKKIDKLIAKLEDSGYGNAPGAISHLRAIKIRHQHNEYNQEKDLRDLADIDCLGVLDDRELNFLR